MLSPLSAGRIFVATTATDLRKSYDGLAALVEGTFGRDLFAGDRFVFLNRRATQMRILYWDSGGYCIWMKRLEAGTFRQSVSDRDEPVIEIDAAELVMLVGGLDASVVHRRKRYTKNRAGDPDAVVLACYHDREC